MNPFGGASVPVKPPEKGSFPLDRAGQVSCMRWCGLGFVWVPGPWACQRRERVDRTRRPGTRRPANADRRVRYMHKQCRKVAHEFLGCIESNGRDYSGACLHVGVWVWGMLVGDGL